MGMTFTQVHVGPRINHTVLIYPSRKTWVKRNFGGTNEGKQGLCVCVCVLGRGSNDRREDGSGTYRFWSATLHLIHEAVWSLPKWCSWLTPGPVDNLPACTPLPTGPPRGTQLSDKEKNHFKNSVVGFTFLQVGGIWPISCYCVPVVCSVGPGAVEDMKE